MKKQHNRAYRIAHYEQILEDQRIYSANRRNDHPDVVAKSMKKWESNHPEFKERTRQRAAQWSRKNPAIVAAKSMARKALKIMAQPTWVNREDLVSFYVEAIRKSLETGIPHEVDHIWPLRGRGFTGLHVPWNLRTIPRADNRSKGNKIPTGEQYGIH